MKVEFSRQIFEKYQISWKSVHLGVSLFHANGQTDGRTDGQTWRS